MIKLCKLWCGFDGVVGNWVGMMEKSEGSKQGKKKALKEQIGSTIDFSCGTENQNRDLSEPEISLFLLLL